jgi:hypothetical protein
MKYIIIVLIIILLFFLVVRENFDPSANLNLLTNSPYRFDNPIRIPISADLDDDTEVPKQFQFDKKLNITTLQKLKAINNILERIKEISMTNNKFNVITFNPALLPVKTFEPEIQKLRVVNQFIINKLTYYSGGQYNFQLVNMDNAYGAETDDQYRVAYILYGSIDDINLKIIVDLIIIKSQTTQTDLNIVFTELRIDNPNVYITPYNNENTDNYELITDYSKSLK